jgi:hypothetical protein
MRVNLAHGGQHTLQIESAVVGREGVSRKALALPLIHLLPREALPALAWDRRSMTSAYPLAVLCSSALRVTFFFIEVSRG